MLASCGLQCLVKDATREEPDKNIASCIDHIYVRVNEAEMSTAAKIIMSTISDHFSLFLNCSINQPSTDTPKEKNEKNTINFKEINKQIKNTNWSEIENNENECEQYFMNIVKKFEQIYNKSKKINKNTKKRNDFPWLSEQIVKYCNIKDKLYQKYRKNKNNLQKKPNIKFLTIN